MEETIEKILQDFKNDYINGSSVLAKKALQILLMLNQMYSIQKKEDLAAIIEFLKHAKPSMASVQNILNYLEKELSASQSSNIAEICMDLLAKMTLCREISLQNAMNYILTKLPNDKISLLTTSVSSTVESFLLKLKSQNVVNVFAMKSVWKGIDYANEMQKFCNENGIQFEKIDVNDLISNKVSIDFAVIGADKVIPQVGVVNGAPSLSMAELCSVIGIPFFVIAESFKYTHDNNYEPEGFDFIPMNLITKVFSDELFIELFMI